ncbi:MAG: glycosyltransferase family 1 protein [Candidatus Omnitrophica bacterium]|nr:glycosyltransferase family 1 protein [Candidatus Omnitrophota bacterium]
MKIAIIFNKIREDTTGIYFERALSSLGAEYDHFWPRDLALLDKKYDLYFRVDDSHFDIAVPASLKPKALWANDTHIPSTFRKLLREARGYDFVFCPLMQGVRQFARHGIKAIWMSQGCDLQIHKRLNLDRDYDIGFVGTDGGVPRKFILQELRERYPASYIGLAPYLKMSEIYSRSKIGFSYTSQQDMMRSYEIMSCGAFLLMYLTSDENISRLGYREGVHYARFGSLSEMFQKIDYYLRHEEERRAIAEEGYRLTITAHRYEDRMRGMLQAAGFRPESSKEPLWH